jgi:hypothetical protein
MAISSICQLKIYSQTFVSSKVPRFLSSRARPRRRTTIPKAMLLRIMDLLTGCFSKFSIVSRFISFRFSPLPFSLSASWRKGRGRGSNDEAKINQHTKVRNGKSVNEGNIPASRKF